MSKNDKAKSPSKKGEASSRRNGKAPKRNIKAVAKTGRTVGGYSEAALVRRRERRDKFAQSASRKKRQSDAQARRANEQKDAELLRKAHKEDSVV